MFSIRPLHRAGRFPAFKPGITFFDTADSYGGGQSEEFLGRALSDRREDAVIASVIAGAAKPDHIRADAEATGWTLTEQEQAEEDRITGRRRARQDSNLRPPA